MNREELLKELNKYKVLPGHGVELDKLTNEQLELRVNLYKSMFQEYFNDKEK